ncbi:MAG: 4-(cytidine 5'-diphospho)-2-C-methyl-D-erythritol kinase [Clostridiales bacterium]|nr:4-(cytidine 5'-diphospho)-2-C-methyl-D-erythritol kinase [Clostridiales bacterium]
MDEIKVLSFAKINLSIDVGAARGDGYHPVDMVMQQLSFHDDVDLKYIRNNDGTRGNIDVQVKTNRYYLPTDNRNLAFKAARLMADRYGKQVDSGTVRIDIKKRIPVAAGLAGGSGNGAAVIHGLNVLWDLGLDLTKVCLLCAELGSDVPFSALGQAKANYIFPKPMRKDPMAASCARATGRGTELEPVEGIRKPVVIAKPSISVSTKEVYQGIDSCEIVSRPDNDKLVEDLAAHSDGAYDNFINVLEAYTLDHYPAVAKLKQVMSETGAEKVLMSGSGPTVFAVYNDMKAAMSACDKLRDKGYEAYWTKTIK